MKITYNIDLNKKQFNGSVTLVPKGYPKKSTVLYTKITFWTHI